MQEDTVNLNLGEYNRLRDFVRDVKKRKNFVVYEAERFGRIKIPRFTVFMGNEELHQEIIKNNKELQNYIGQLIREKEELQKEIEECSYLKSSFASRNKRLGKKLRELRVENKKLKKKLEPKYMLFKMVSDFFSTAYLSRLSNKKS